MAEAEDTAAGVFGDAAAEFAELRFVKNRLEQWKATQPASYRDCYVALSAPQLFAPYVRLQTLGWAPLFSSTGLDSMNWYVSSGTVTASRAQWTVQPPDTAATFIPPAHSLKLTPCRCDCRYSLLFDYGMPASGDTEMAADDDDQNLVPAIVERVALPVRFSHAAARVDYLDETAAWTRCVTFRYTQAARTRCRILHIRFTSAARNDPRALSVHSNELGGGWG
jgi:hypothetical protein